MSLIEITRYEETFTFRVIETSNVYKVTFLSYKSKDKCWYYFDGFNLSNIHYSKVVLHGGVLAEFHEKVYQQFPDMKCHNTIYSNIV